MNKIGCPLRDNQPAPCESCPLQAFKNRADFSVEERELRRAYNSGFDSVDLENPQADRGNAAYLYDFANAAEVGLVSPLQPFEASIQGTPDNKFILGVLECLGRRFLSS